MRRRTQCACHHSVGIAALDHQATEIERVTNLLASLLDRYAFLLSELLEKLGIRLCKLNIVLIDKFSFLNMLEAELKGLGKYLFFLADEYHVGYAGFYHAVGRLECTRLKRFGKHQTLAVLLRTLGESFKQFHVISFLGFISQNYKKFPCLTKNF